MILSSVTANQGHEPTSLNSALLRWLSGVIFNTNRCFIKEKGARTICMLPVLAPFQYCQQDECINLPRLPLCWTQPKPGHPQRCPGPLSTLHRSLPEVQAPEVRCQTCSLDENEAAPMSRRQHF